MALRISKKISVNCKSFTRPDAKPSFSNQWKKNFQRKNVLISPFDPFILTLTSSMWLKYYMLWKVRSKKWYFSNYLSFSKSQQKWEMSPECAFVENIKNNGVKPREFHVCLRPCYKKWFYYLWFQEISQTSEFYRVFQFPQGTFPVHEIINN